MHRDRLLRLPEVIAIVGLSRSTIYAMMEKSLFPQQVRLGQRSVAWWESEINEWIASRPRAKDRSEQGNARNKAG